MYICLRGVNNIIELDNGWYVDTDNWASILVYICLHGVNNIIELDNGWYGDTDNWAY